MKCQKPLFPDVIVLLLGGVEAIISSKSCHCFTSDITIKSYPKYSPHSLRPSRAGTNRNKATYFLQMTYILSFSAQGKAQGKIKCSCASSVPSGELGLLTNLYFFRTPVVHVLTLFGLGGGAILPPLRVFAKYLKNGLANLHETL